MQQSIDEAGKQVVGISPQGPDSHKRFSTSFNLGFPLLCDTRKEVIRSYGVDGPLGMGVRRVTFLIDTDGIIEDRLVSDFMVGSHARFVEKSL